MKFSKHIFFFVLVAAFGLPVTAAEKDNCKALAPALAEVSKSMAKMLASMQGLDYDNVIKEFSGERREKLVTLRDKQDAVLGPFKDYVYALEDAELTFRRCAR